MADPAQPRFNNFTKYFLPGLALGVVIGGVIGAFVAPKFESHVPEIKPRAGARPATQPPPTGSTCATEPEQRQPEPPPSAAPTGTPK